MGFPSNFEFQGTLNLGSASSRLPFGRGFAGKAKRVARVKAVVADLLFDFEGAERVVASYHDGAILLAGEVASEAHLRTMEEQIRKIPGVTDVRLAVRIVEKTDRAQVSPAPDQGLDL